MNVKKRLFAAAMLIALSAAGALISGSQNVAKAGPGASQVTIAGPLPLPITGSATVSGTVAATQSGTWNVGITGQPVNVNVGNLPAVSLAGTPTVNANVTFPATQGVTVSAAGPLTNVGRLPSQQVTLEGPISICGSTWALVDPNGNGQVCFDMANHSGEVLVITDFSWMATTNPGATCALSITGAVTGSGRYLLSAAVGASDGFAAKTEHLTTGSTLTVNPVVGGLPAAGLAPCTPLPNLGAMITGYLMPNQ